ncbi:hypothetical protein HYW74_01710 [Candidatus Pacearchaeota archaeon]|nr:hypothetical protein [Candidatus Pacearchaeota archaeon]
MEKLSDPLNIILGIISLLSIISGYFIKEYQVIFWTFGLSLLVLVVISYYVVENNRRVSDLSFKFKKIEESLNIYDRLNNLEIKMGNMIKAKKGQFRLDLMDIIKIGIAIILIWAFIQAIKSLIS